MTDDIVTRLREVSCDNRWCGNDPYCRLCDAADEIERLRKYIALLSLTIEMQTKELKELKND